MPFDTPGRLLDTRNGTGGITGKLTQGSTNAFGVLGHAGVPATGVRAVLVTVAALAPSASTFLEMWPDGESRPGGSMLSVQQGQTLSNSAVVAPGANGEVDIYNAVGSTDAVVDVEGYFTEKSGGAGGGFVPVTQTRLVDTRSGLGTPQGAIPAHGSITVTLATPPVPDTANAVFLGVTVPGSSTSGFLSAFPAGGTDGNPIKNFTSGDTAEGAAVKLGQNGQVTFVNHSGAAVNLVLDVEGYFAATSSVGAGLRMATARLLNTAAAGTPIPANGTVDISVGGSHGLPTRDIAGAVLNFTTVNQEAMGFIRAWPVGDAEPGTSLDNFVRHQNRAHQAVIRPGVDGKIRVRNDSAGTINLVVDLQGWFADPLPAVPLSQFAPTVGVQASPKEGGSVGTIEYAYVDSAGQLWHGHQDDPGNFASVTWSVISDVSQAFTGEPGLAEQSDGSMQVVGQTIDSNVSVDTQTADQSPPTWGPWVGVGGSMASHPAIARLGDGRMVVFAVDADGQLWALPQDGVNGPYTAWQPLGDADLVGAPTVVSVGGNIQVFALDSSGAVKTAVYNGVLSGWTDLGGTGFTGSPAVVVNPGLRLQVVVRAADGSIQGKEQDVSHAWPATWDTVGTGTITAAGSPAAIFDSATAHTVVVVRGTDSAIHSTEETVPGSGTWSSWVVESGTADTVTDPTVFPFTNADGPGWALVVRSTASKPKGIPHQTSTAPAGLTFPVPAQ